MRDWREKRGTNECFYEKGMRIEPRGAQLGIRHQHEDRGAAPKSVEARQEH